MKVICIGQAAYDITLPLENYPIENKKVRTTGKVECGGGSASNCAYLLSKWGVESYFAGIVGNDYYGKSILKEFDDINVNCKYVDIVDGYPTTASYIINNTSSGTRTIITSRKTGIPLKEKEISDKFDCIVLDGYEKEFAKAVINENPQAIKILDAGSLKEGTVELAYLVDYVVCSKDFAEEFSKMQVDYTDLKSLVAIHSMLENEFKKKIVITLESKGCFTYDNGYKIVPSMKVKQVDSTGAGDIFHGAFAYCLMMGYDLIRTLKISNITGALSVLKIGGRFSIPELDEVMNKYNEYTGQK